MYHFFRILHISFLEEFRRVKQDKGALLILVLAVMAYPLVYSVAYKNNVLRDLPVAVVDLDHTALSRKTASAIHATPQLNISSKVGSMIEAKKLFNDGEVNGVLLIPEGFERKVLRGGRSIVSVYCDASYFLMYKETLSATLSAVGTLSAGVEVMRLMASGKNINQAVLSRDPVPTKIYSLFNPSGGYGSYVMPGMILVILQQTLLVGIGIIGGGRKEYGKLGGHIVNQTSLAGYLPVVMGRSIVYFLMYAVNAVFVLYWIYHWFGFPDKATLLNIAVMLIPFLFSVIFIGLGISQLFKRREHSIMFLVFLSPLVLFVSGLSWPVIAIPKLIYVVGHLFPTTFMIPGYLRLRTMGVALQDVQFEFWAMMLQMLLYLFIAVGSIRFAVWRNRKK